MSGNQYATLIGQTLNDFRQLRDAAESRGFNNLAAIGYSTDDVPTLRDYGLHPCGDSSVVGEGALCVSVMASALSNMGSVHVFMPYRLLSGRCPKIAQGVDLFFAMGWSVHSVNVIEVRDLMAAMQVDPA